ncbi:MAG: hypothetical protein JJ979_25360 [Roseibium sp.]|nr:hypothetical protein [Roseibium sp.]
MAANLQDASDNAGANVADYGDVLESTVVAAGGSGGSTEKDTVELDFDLTGAKRYIRPQFTPDLSAANTDTATVSATLVLMGTRKQPVSKALN